MKLLPKSHPKLQMNQGRTLVGPKPPAMVEVTSPQMSKQLNRLIVQMVRLTRQRPARVTLQV